MESGKNEFSAFALVWDDKSMSLVSKISCFRVVKSASGRHTR